MRISPVCASLLVAALGHIGGATGGAPPAARVYPGLNQVFDVAQPGRNTTTIRFLGVLPTFAACEEACVAVKNTRCWSFTWHGGVPVASPFHKQCFGIIAPRWSPTPDQDGIISGYIDWPCRDDLDCSLNGKCVQSKSECACRPAWTGHRCEKLALSPATRGADGYRGVDGGHNTSSWGGAVPAARTTLLAYVASRDRALWNRRVGSKQQDRARTPRTQPGLTRKQVVGGVFP